jgi:hypothetical protein
MEKSKRAELEWTDDARAQVRKMIAEGLTRNQIALRMSVELGTLVSRNAIAGLCHRMDVRSPARSTKVRREVEPKEPRVRLAIVAKAPMSSALVGEPIGPLNDFPPHGKCRFINGDPGSGDWQCCGHDVYADRPYCGHHLIKCTTTQPVRKRERPVDLGRHPGSWISAARIVGFI